MPEVEVLDGTAEALPLPDGSVDAVTVAQAFHWFDAPAAPWPRSRRVLRPGGGLVLVWNDARRDVPLGARRFGDLLVDGPDVERPYDSYYDVDWRPWSAESGGFTPVERSHAWEQPSDPDMLVARAGR